MCTLTGFHGVQPNALCGAAGTGFQGLACAVVVRHVNLMGDRRTNVRRGRRKPTCQSTPLHAVPFRSVPLVGPKTDLSKLGSKPRRRKSPLHGPARFASPFVRCAEIIVLAVASGNEGQLPGGSTPRS